jgi:hypothetical protein
MDVSLMSVLKILGDFGVLGLVIFLWWSDNKRVWAVLNQYKADMIEQREMYRANVSLCRDFAEIARDLRDIVTLNIQKMTEVTDAVKQNQYCPLIRLDKQKVMPLTQIHKDNIQGGT